MKTLRTISDASSTTASETSSLSSSSPTFQVYRKVFDDDEQYKESDEGGVKDDVDERLLSILIHQEDDNDDDCDSIMNCNENMHEKPTTHNNSRQNPFSDYIESSINDKELFSLLEDDMSVIDDISEIGATTIPESSSSSIQEYEYIHRNPATRPLAKLTVGLLSTYSFAYRTLCQQDEEYKKACQHYHNNDGKYQQQQQETSFPMDIEPIPYQNDDESVVSSLSSSLSSLPSTSPTIPAKRMTVTMEQPPPPASPPTVAPTYQKLPKIMWTGDPHYDNLYRMKANMEAVKAHRIIHASRDNAASPENDKASPTTTTTTPFKTIVNESSGLVRPIPIAAKENGVTTMSMTKSSFKTTTSAFNVVPKKKNASQHSSSVPSIRPKVTPLQKNVSPLTTTTNNERLSEENSIPSSLSTATTTTTSAASQSQNSSTITTKVSPLTPIPESPQSANEAITTTTSETLPKMAASTINQNSTTTTAAESASTDEKKSSSQKDSTTASTDKKKKSTTKQITSMLSKMTLTKKKKKKKDIPVAPSAPVLAVIY